MTSLLFLGLACAEPDVRRELAALGYTVRSLQPAEASTIGPRRCGAHERAYTVHALRFPVPGEPCTRVRLVLRVCVPDYGDWTTIPLLSRCGPELERSGP